MTLRWASAVQAVQPLRHEVVGCPAAHRPVREEVRVSHKWILGLLGLAQSPWRKGWAIFHVQIRQLLERAGHAEHWGWVRHTVTLRVVRDCRSPEFGAY